MGRRDCIPPERFSSPWGSYGGWNFLGCHHGLALVICRARREAIVWDPLTGHQRRIAFPPGFKEQFVQNAAVMCAAAQDGHVHGDCRFTPFRLAMVCESEGPDALFACLYESESGVWGDIVSVQTIHSISTMNPSVLVRDVFCWLLSGCAILEFDFQRQSLAVIQKPADAPSANYYDRSVFSVVRTEHNGLGFAALLKLGHGSKIIRLWGRKSKCDGVVGWELQKAIQLDGLVSPGKTLAQTTVLMQGYDEETNAIFLSTFFGDHMLQLESTQFTNLIEIRRPYLSSRNCYPYRNFYITGSGVGGRDGGAEM